MKISLIPNDWTKLRQYLQRIVTTKFFAPDIKKGISQTDAGAVKNELWVDTANGHTIKLGQ
ncbi:MAG: hypothetical protein JW912_07565 [Sedimentisphaerales bacterium]|nr:hypothetical protein [Sedimentisphaerales bacterium]